MASLLGWPLIVYYLTLPRANLSGWEVADVWLVLTGPLLPLPFHTSFAFKIQSETWGSFLTKSLASPCTSTSSLAPAIISFASCELCLAFCPAALQPPSYMQLSQVGWTTVSRSWRACLWLKLPVLIGFFAVPLVSLGAHRNMVLFRLICMRDTLHWLPIAQRICYRIDVLVWRCIL